MKKTCAVSLLAFLFFPLAGSSALATTQYLIGVENIKSSSTDRESGDNYSVYFQDLLEHFASSREYVFVYKTYPTARLTRSLLNGKVDFKCPDNNNWAAETKKGTDISYSDSLVESIEGVLVKPKKVSEGLKSFHLLGIPLGFTPVAFQDLIQNGKVTLINNASFQGLISQAILGRIDGAYYNINSANAILETMGKSGQLVYNPNLPSVKVSYSISSIKHEGVIREINLFMKNNPRLIAKLKRKYKLE